MANMSENLLGRNAMTGSIADPGIADNIVLNAKKGQALEPNPLALAFADPITLREEAAEAGVKPKDLTSLTPNDLVFAIRVANGDVR